MQKSFGFIQTARKTRTTKGPRGCYIGDTRA